MIAKFCEGPKGGAGSASLSVYLTVYAIAGKDATPEEREAAIAALYAEAEARTDRGAGAIWRPAVGHGTRPSSVLVTNASSYTTFDLEVDYLASLNPGVRHSSMHMVLSFQTSETGGMTDERAHDAAQDWLKLMGLDEHLSQVVIHRDTIVYDRDADGNIKLDIAGNPIVKDGNLHAHINVSTVDPKTLLAYDRTGLHKKMARCAREVEIDHELNHDNGLYVVRFKDGKKVAQEASPEELAAWRTERKDERLARLEVKSAEGFVRRDKDFTRFADSTVAPRLAQRIGMAQVRGRTATWADAHAEAARYGCILQQNDNGEIVLRDVGALEMKVKHARERNDLRAKLENEGAERDVIDEKVAEMKAERTKVEADERALKMTTGATVKLDAVLRVDRRDLGPFLEVDAAEQQLIVQIEKDPALVLREVTSSSSTFDRSEIDMFIARRISDPDTIQRLGDLVMQHESIRIVNVDARWPVMTTTEVLAVEDRLLDDATTLARRASGISAESVEAGIVRYEREMTAEKRASGEFAATQSFKLSGEQKDALRMVTRGSLCELEGLPGTGKTCIMAALRCVAEEAKNRREIRGDVFGVSLAQIAAERLAVEAGFETVNCARARILEENGTAVVPYNGVLVIEEASMIDSRMMQGLIQTAKERDTLVYVILDDRQMSSIDYGQSSKFLKDATKGAGTYGEMREIQRQKREWHREAIYMYAKAFNEKDETKRTALIEKSLQAFEAHGELVFEAKRDDVIDRAVADTRAFEATAEKNGWKKGVLLNAPDNDLVRHLAEESRRQNGLEKRGFVFETVYGEREVAVGDAIMFRENNAGKKGRLGVLNGEVGTVLDVTKHGITVEITDPKNGAKRTVCFDPKKYDTYDHANAMTTTKTQGASVNASVDTPTRATGMQQMFVMISRAMHESRHVVNGMEFQDTHAMAEHLSKSYERAKTTSHHFEHVVQRTGGKETMRVLNMSEQAEAANSPLRRLWEEEQKVPADLLRAKRVDEARATYKDRLAALDADATLSVEQRIDARKDAFKTMSAGVAGLREKAWQPQSYLDWLHEREYAHDVAREVQMKRDLGREKIAQREAQRTTDRPREATSSPVETREMTIAEKLRNAAGDIKEKAERELRRAGEIRRTQEALRSESDPKKIAVLNKTLADLGYSQKRGMSQ